MPVSSVSNRIRRRPLFFSLQRTATDGTEIDGGAGAARLFAEALRHFAALRGRVAVDTPIRPRRRVGALNVAADAVWTSRRAILHGAIAWRSKLLAGGALRLERSAGTNHARSILCMGRPAERQPVPEKRPPADEFGAPRAQRSGAAHQRRPVESHTT